MERDRLEQIGRPKKRKKDWTLFNSTVIKGFLRGQQRLYLGNSSLPNFGIPLISVWDI